MKKSIYSSIAGLFVMCSLHAQKAPDADSNNRNNKPLLNYDWGTSLDDLGKNSVKNDIGSYLDFGKTFDNPRFAGTLNYPKPAANMAKMPIYEPKGMHKLRVFAVDSTTQFYLRIYGAH